MGVKTFSDNAETKYTFHRKAGRSIIERRPIFAPDGESVVVIVENVIRVYSIQTGDCVKTLETENVVKELIGHQFPDDEDYNLYACSDNGWVTTWTWENGAVLREIKISTPSDMKILTFNMVNSKECFITAAGNKNFLYLASFSTKTGDLIHHYTGSKPLNTDIVRVSIGSCNGDKYAAISNGTKCVFIQNLNQPHQYSEIINHNKFRVLAVAAHSKESAIAITDTLGRVTIIRGNLYDYKKIAREVMHWHFLPPMAISFSELGNYLYSGGMEKVLVKWTIGSISNKANEKMFIPRLPGMVRYIAVNNTHVALTLTNNCIVIATSQMSVVSTILECGGLSPVARAIGTSLVYHKTLGALLMGGRTGHLQLYSTTTDKVLYNIDITAMNNIPPVRRNLLPLETEVTCSAVSGNGMWLVTSEYRNDGVTYPEEMLKFWKLQQNQSSPFKLNTCINLSHGGSNVVSLALNNRGEFCVSAGGDQKFRIWKKSKSSSGQFSWSCLTACYYSSGVAQFLSSTVLNKFKNGEGYEPGKVENLPYMTDFGRNDIIKRLFNIHKEPSLFDAEYFDTRKDSEFDVGGVAISQDGSLIAAWFGCKLTLWDTHLCTLRTTLSHPALRPKGEHVQFGNQDAAHYLVCTTEQCVAVWSLLSLTVKWLVQIHPTSLTADPYSNRMAVTTANNDIFVFTPHSSTPILTRKSVLNPKTGVFKLCTFGSSSVHGSISLYVVRNDSEIYSLEPEHKETDSLEVMSRRNLPVSTFSSLLAEQQLSEVQPAMPLEAQSFDTTITGRDALLQFLTAAPHMVPSVSLLCTSLLQNVSGQQQPEDEQEKQEDKEVDADSSDDEDVTPKSNGPYTPKVKQFWTPNYSEIKEKRLKKILKEPFLDLQTTQTLFNT